MRLREHGGTTWMVLAANRDVRLVRRLRQHRNSVWLVGLAFGCGVAPVVIACIVHNRCSASDPACIFHSYTLVHTAGPAILGFVGAPALISMVVAVLLWIKITRRSVAAGEIAWSLAVLSCIIGLLGLAVEGFLMLLAAGLTVGAVAATPIPPDPNDRLLRSGGGLSRLPRHQ